MNIEDLNQPINNGKAEFDVILVNVQCDIPNEQATMRINLRPEQFASIRNQSVFRMPVFPVGSLVILVSDRICVHAGIITQVLDDEALPTFVINTWPLIESIVLHRIGFGYLFDGALGNESLIGKVIKLPKIEADAFREKIALRVTPALQDIFWSLAEQREIEEQMIAQDRYFELATALINRN